MSDEIPAVDDGNGERGDARDEALAAAGSRLRDRSQPLDAAGIEVGALRRRARRRGVVAGIASVVAVVAVVGAAVFAGRGEPTSVAGGGGGGPSVDRIVANLAAQPIDPRNVHLVSTVETFPGCDALLGDLRRVGAEHVGSRGFGATDGFIGDRFMAGVASGNKLVADQAASVGAPTGETLGTNVQVTGVDELDHVKADGKWIYDLDGKGNLRITDATSLQVVGTVRIIPDPNRPISDGRQPDQWQQIDSLLEHDGRVAVFGSKSVTSKPVPGDPSATQATTQYLTVTFVDASDPVKAVVTDQVRIEGSLVSARLVDGQVRLVTTSNMADLGFVMPTTPTSVAKALDRNRRSVAASAVGDWIPEWQRKGGPSQRLVPCERVHVPSTFAGVAMTSLVSFGIDDGRFAPEATSILAPGDTLYAGVENVAISSHVWVDPIDQGRLKFDDWQTAVHEFSFAAKGAPRYAGSGIVDGSTVGQFAFGEIGDALGVVTTKGTPWSQNTKNAVDLIVLRADGKGELTRAAEVTDLAGGKGTVSAVRFTPGRVLVSTGAYANLVRVIDTDDPAKPRRAGSVTLPGPTGYFHPLGDHRALLVGSRTDQVDGPDGKVTRGWVVADQLDVSDPDQPRLTGSWETPWASDQVGSDHHAFTYWASKALAMWGIQSAGIDYGAEPNHAVVLSVGEGGLTQKAFPTASQPPATPPPCATYPVDDPNLRGMIGKNTIVLACGEPDRAALEWPRYSCSKVGPDLLRQYAPDQVGRGSFFLCNVAPQPTVSRVLVVDGRTILLTDQTLEVLDPDTFASRQVVFHPSAWGGYGPMPVD